MAGFHYSILHFMTTATPLPSAAGSTPAAAVNHTVAAKGVVGLLIIGFCVVCLLFLLIRKLTDHPLQVEGKRPNIQSLIPII